MVRVMLALLALLGFAAQAVPAQARLSGAGGTEVGSVEAKPAAVRAAVTVQALPEPVEVFDPAAVAPDSQTASRAVPVPTVRLRIDRSHE